MPRLEVMPVITLIQAEAKLDELMKAHTAVTLGQAWTIGSRQLTRANLKDIEAGIQFWERKISRLTRGGGLRVKGVTPIAS